MLVTLQDVNNIIITTDVYLLQIYSTHKYFSEKFISDVFE